MYEGDRTAEPCTRRASVPNRATVRRDWRQAAAEELEDLGDLYTLPEGLEVPL